MSVCFWFIRVAVLVLIFSHKFSVSVDIIGNTFPLQRNTRTFKSVLKKNINIPYQNSTDLFNYKHYQLLSCSSFQAFVQDPSKSSEFSGIRFTPYFNRVTDVRIQWAKLKKFQVIFRYESWEFVENSNWPTDFFCKQSMWFPKDNLSSIITAKKLIYLLCGRVWSRMKIIGATSANLLEYTEN